jgi:glucose/arabinose dehydrogenase
MVRATIVLKATRDHPICDSDFISLAKNRTAGAGSVRRRIIIESPFKAERLEQEPYWLERRFKMNKRFALIALTALTVFVTACQTGKPITSPPAPPSPPTPPSPPSPPPSGTLKLGTQQVGSGFDQPLYVTYAPGANDLYVVEKSGKVEILEGSGPRSTAFLNVSSKLTTGGEQGLLSIAFHPNYASNSYVYAFYSRSDGDSVIARFTANRTAKTVDVATEKVLLVIDRIQSRDNHNGGQLQFGPDGYLYISAGDGGSQDDPDGNGQNKSVLNGKILRIEVKDDGTYASPASNPFKPGGNERSEIWAYGLRNPWRFSFDKSTGDLWIGDVGGGLAEEVNFQARNATDAMGRNYGWHVIEGNNCVTSGCDKSGKTMPVFTYAHTGGNCSITGGYVYRGTQYAAMQGRYFMGDYCTGTIWSVVPNGSGGWTTKIEKSNAVPNLSGFGEGSDGSLYATDLAGGKVYKLIAQ